MKEQFQHVFLNAMDIISIYDTLRFIGTINGRSVEILLDGGNYDNIMQLRVSKFLCLDVFIVKPFKVLVGNGNSL